MLVKAMMQAMGDDGVHDKWCLMNGKMEYPLHSLLLEKTKKVSSIRSCNHYHKNAK
jgi:hypothetical protein